MADIMRKPGKRTGGVILRCRLWHRMQGKPTRRTAGTEEGDSLHARRVSVLRKSGVKIFYFRYFVIMRFCGTAHRCLTTCPGQLAGLLFGMKERFSCIRKQTLPPSGIMDYVCLMFSSDPNRSSYFHSYTVLLSA